MHLAWSQSVTHIGYRDFGSKYIKRPGKVRDLREGMGGGRMAKDVIYGDGFWEETQALFR
jgi:hypothetical protein